jgi:hypothetical protein
MLKKHSSKESSKFNNLSPIRSYAPSRNNRFSLSHTPAHETSQGPTIVSDYGTGLNYAATNIFSGMGTGISNTTRNGLNRNNLDLIISQQLLQSGTNYEQS